MDPSCRAPRRRGRRRSRPGAREAPTTTSAVRRAFVVVALLSVLAPRRVEAVPQLLATMELVFRGPGVTRSSAFVEELDDAITAMTGWVSVDDFSPFKIVDFGSCEQLPPALVGNMLAPSPLPPKVSNDTSVAPPPSGRRLLARKNGKGSSPSPAPSLDDANDCKALVASTSLSPLAVPSPKEFEQLPDAINSGAVAGELRRRGFQVSQVGIVDLRVDNALLQARGGKEAAPPPGATGISTVVFTLRLMGPDAVLGNGGLLRVLMVDGIASQIAGGARSSNGTGTGNDAVSVSNARLVNVKLVKGPGGSGGGSGAKRRRSLLGEASRRRSMLLLEGAPPAGSPERAAAVAKASAETAVDSAAVKKAAATDVGNGSSSSSSPSSPSPSSSPGGNGQLPYQFDYAAGAEPTIDVTTKITHLSKEAVKRVYDDVLTLSDTNQFTNLLKAAGYRIDSVRTAPVPGWFQVDGRIYGSGGPSLVARAAAGQGAPLAMAILVPLSLFALGVAVACFFCVPAQRRRREQERESGVYYKSAGCWPRVLGGRSMPRSTGLDAAVAAAVRKSGGPVSAAELLLRDIESGGKVAAAGGRSGSVGGSASGFLSAKSVGSNGAAGGALSSSADGGSLSAAAAAAAANPELAASASPSIDDDPYGRLARGWQLDPSSLQILTRPDGTEWELGSGTSGRVYKALYNGVQEVAVKVFNEALPSLAALAEARREEALAAAAAAAEGSGTRSPSGDRRRRSGSGELSGKIRSAFRAAVALGRLGGRKSKSCGSIDGGLGASGGSVEKGEGRADAPPATAVVSPPSSLATTTEATSASLSSSNAPGAAATIASAPAGGSVAKAGGVEANGAVGPPPPPPLSRQRAAAQQQLEDLAREVLLLRACHDRNVVSFVGASVQSGHAVLVTEYMPNGDLYSAIRDDGIGRFRWRRSPGPSGRPLPNTGINRRVALDIARGLHFLHSRRVVHLDLKSPNVLLGRDWTAKVADVGLSKILRDRFLSTMQAVGTFAWAAPEVLLGKPTAESADVYSFGVLLWELSTGEAPPGRALREIEVPEEAPREVADLIARCLDEDATRRPTALELVHFFKDLEVKEPPTRQQEEAARAEARASSSPSAVGSRRGTGSVAGSRSETEGPAAGRETLARRLSKRISKVLSKERDSKEASRDDEVGARAPAASAARPPVLPNPFGGGGGSGGAAPAPVAPDAAPDAAPAPDAARAPFVSPFGGTAGGPPVSAFGGGAAPAATTRTKKEEASEEKGGGV